MTVQRWEEAQQAQKKFWQSRNSMTHISEKFWAKRLNRGLNLNYDFFKNKDVLEVGCGATGIIYFLENTKTRIGIEPMDVNDLIEDWKRPYVRKGVGEELPFENKCFDIVVCFSVLDQVIDPGKLIQEVHRVLRHKGEFFLWFQSLRNVYKFLQPILNKLDVLRPHHFTLKEILTPALINNNFFEVRKENVSKGLGLSLKLYLPITQKRIKNLIGNIIMDNVWLWLRKA